MLQFEKYSIVVERSVTRPTPHRSGRAELPHPAPQIYIHSSRLCKAESAGKSYGTQENKIGNGHLKWAFSEMTVLYLRNNPKAKKYLQKLQRRMSKAKALSALAHKLGRCVYYMLKKKSLFDETRLLG